MATNMGYPNAGIVSVMGQQNNPMGGVVQPRNTNMFNPQENVEDTIIRLYQTNVPIDQIAAMTGTDSTTVAQVINNSRGMDTYANTRDITPPIGAPDIEVEQAEFDTDLPSPQDYYTRPDGAQPVEIEQQVFSTDLPDDMGTQALTGLNPQYAELHPDAVSEARKIDAQIQRTSREVFGVGENDPNLVQELNAVELSVLEDFESEGDGTSSGVVGAVQENALVKIGLNDVFSDANMPIEDRIDFFKHYIAETLGLDYGNLKDAPDEGLPFLAAASALLNASKSGDSRMSGIGQALVSFGMTKNQLGRVRNKDAKDLLMTSFNLGLESHKIAQAGTGEMGATEWVTVPWSDDPVLLPKKSVVAGIQSGVKILPYNKDKDSKTKLYSIPKMTKDGIVYSYRKMTEPQYQNALKNLDSDLITKGYTIQEADQGDRSKNILYTTPGGDREIMTQADYFAMPFEQQTGFEEISGMNAVIDTTDGNKQKYVTDEELALAPPGQFQSLTYGTYFESDGEGGFVFSTGGGKDEVLTGQTDRGIERIKAATKEPLQEKIKQSKATFRLLDRSRDLAREGLFGAASTGVAKVGNLIKSVEGVINAYQSGLNKKQRADYDRMKRDWYQQVGEDEGFIKFLENTGADKDRLMGTFWSLALASAQILNDQKGRDISNVDAERFLNRVGANSSSVNAVQMMLDDLEMDLIHAQLDQFDIEEDGLESFPTGDLDDDGNEIMQRIFSKPGELFGEGGLIEQERANLEQRLKVLESIRGGAVTNTGTPVPIKARPMSFSELRRTIEQNDTEALNTVNPASKPDVDVTWGVLAKIIFRDQFLGNEPEDVRMKKVDSRLRDHFYNDEEALKEFKLWYKTLINK